MNSKSLLLHNELSCGQLCLVVHVTDNFVHSLSHQGQQVFSRAEALRCQTEQTGWVGRLVAGWVTVSNVFFVK